MITKIYEISQFDYIGEKEFKQLLGDDMIKIKKVDLKKDNCPLGYYWKDIKTGEIIKSNYDRSD